MKNRTPGSLRRIFGAATTYEGKVVRAGTYQDKKKGFQMALVVDSHPGEVLTGDCDSPAKGMLHPGDRVMFSWHKRHGVDQIEIVEPE